MLDRTKLHEPGLAVLDYGTPDFDVVRPGRFVRCAVTGVAIELEDLRYWSVELQEAYADAASATTRWLATGGKARLANPSS